MQRLGRQRLAAFLALPTMAGVAVCAVPARGTDGEDRSASIPAKFEDVTTETAASARTADDRATDASPSETDAPIGPTMLRFTDRRAWSLAFAKDSSAKAVSRASGIDRKRLAMLWYMSTRGAAGARRSVLGAGLRGSILEDADRPGTSAFRGELALDLDAARARTPIAMSDPLSSSLVEWQPELDENGRLSVHLGSASRGPSTVSGLSIGYEAMQGLSFSSGVGLAQTMHEYRLEGEGAGLGPVGRRRSMPFVAGVDWSPRPGVWMSGYAGASLLRDLDQFGRSRDALRSLDLDPSPVLGFDLSLSF